MKAKCCSSTRNNIIKILLRCYKENNVDISKINQLNSILDAQTLLASGDADAVVTTISNFAVFENAGLGNIIIDSSNDSSLSSVSYLQVEVSG